VLDVTEQLLRYGTAIERVLVDDLTHAPAPTADGTVTPGTRLDDTDLQALEPLEPPAIEVTVVSLEPTPRGRPGHRRLLVAAAAVATVVALAVAGIAISNDDPSRVASSAPTPTTTPPDTTPPRVIGLPPAGAAPSAPVKGLILLSLQACDGPSSLPWSGNLALYADGRLLWHTNDDPFEGDPSGGDGPRPKTGWLEQRLTPEGTELLRSELASSGLLSPRRELTYTCPDDSYRADARIGDHYEYYVGKLPRDLVERIAEPASWLPASAWQDREVRPFVPASYTICISGLEPLWPSVAEIAAALPARVGDLVRARDWAENHNGPSQWFWCTGGVATEDARTFAEALNAAAIDRNEHPWVPGPEYVFEYQNASRSQLLHIGFLPSIPAGSPSGAILR
jgi:hypothetical protein